MDDKQQFEHFVKLLMQSGLDEERVRFWVTKIENEDFSEADENALTRELEEHLVRVDEAIAVTEADVVEKEKIFAEKVDKSLPYLQKLADEQPAVQEKQEQDYKKTIMQGEKKALDKIEGIRAGAESSQIEAIRKGLSK